MNPTKSHTHLTFLSISKVFFRRKNISKYTTYNATQHSYFQNILFQRKDHTTSSHRVPQAHFHLYSAQALCHWHTNSAQALFRISQAPQAPFQRQRRFSLSATGALLPNGLQCASTVSPVQFFHQCSVSCCHVQMLLCF